MFAKPAATMYLPRATREGKAEPAGTEPGSGVATSDQAAVQ